MWARRRRVVASALSAMAVTGCSLLYDVNHLSVEDAGPSGDSSMTTASLCTPELLFCDGFEGDLSKWGTVLSGGGMASIDGAHTYRGNGALHVTLPANATSDDAGAPSAGLTAQQASGWPSHLYARMYIYLSAPPTDSTQLMSFVGTGGLAIYVTGPDDDLHASSFGISGGTTTISTTVLRPQTFGCLGLEIDSLAQTVQVSLDAMTIATLDQTNVQFSSLTSFAIGIMTAGVPYEAWIDEVAVDSNPLGCP